MKQNVYKHFHKPADCHHSYFFTSYQTVEELVNRVGKVFLCKTPCDDGCSCGGQEPNTIQLNSNELNIYDTHVIS